MVLRQGCRWLSLTGLVLAAAVRLTATALPRNEHLPQPLPVRHAWLQELHLPGCCLAAGSSAKQELGSERRETAPTHLDHVVALPDSVPAELLGAADSLPVPKRALPCTCAGGPQSDQGKQEKKTGTGV
jgi:hypothetical protein